MVLLVWPTQEVLYVYEEDYSLIKEGNMRERITKVGCDNFDEKTKKCSIEFTIMPEFPKENKKVTKKCILSDLKDLE